MDDKKADIQKLIKEGVDSKKGAPVIHVDFKGNTKVGNIGTQQNTYNIKTEKVTPKTIVEVKPSEEHISERQASNIKSMVETIVNLEESTKRTPKGYQAVYSGLNRHCKVTQYRMIKKEDYGKAIGYLSQWKGRLMAGKSAKKGEDWRKDRYKSINMNVKRMDCEDYYRNYMMQRFGHDSATQLSSDELDKLYRAVLGWKKRKKF